MAKEKFKPLAGNTYNVMLNRDKPFHNPAKVVDGNEWSENWNYLVCVDSGEEMYWYVYSQRVMEVFESIGYKKGSIIQVSVSEKMGENNKPYRVYKFTKDDQTWTTEKAGTSTGEIQPQQTQEVQPQTAIQTKPKPPDPTEELDKHKRLMAWCINSIEEMAPEEYTPADKIKLAITLMIDCKGIYPPKPEIEVQAEEAEKRFNEGNQSLPEPQNIHGQEPPLPEDNDQPPF